jgi:hypothetical protein
MDEPTLAWEAQGPCMKAALMAFVVTPTTVVKRREARRYLSSMIEIKRKKDGKAPPWLYELAIHAEQGAVQRCTDVAQKLYLPPEAPPEGQDQAAQKQPAEDRPATKATKK